MKLPAEDFINSSCELATPLNVFLAVYLLSNGEPCNGCAYDSHGSECKARQKLFPKHQARAPLQEPRETVRETAAILGMSISEVRRRRRKAGGL